MNNLTQRAITGTILALFITASISWNAYSFIFLILAIDLLALLEFYRLFHDAGLSPLKMGGLILSTSQILTSALIISSLIEPQVLLINIPIASGIFICELFRQETNPFHNLAFTFLNDESIQGSPSEICGPHVGENTSFDRSNGIAAKK